jgi:hypothetical protein
MKNAVNTLKQLRPATVIALIALFVAVGGTATAASGLINGKKLKNNTVAGKKLKNKTVTKKKLAPATIKALKGQQGPKGDKGDQGAPGVPGQNGVVSPVSDEFGSLNIPADTELALGAINVPSGKYLVTATVSVTSNATDVISCGISANHDGGFSTAVFDPNGGGRVTLPSQLVTETDDVTQLTLGCAAGNQVAGVSGSIIATPDQYHSDRPRRVRAASGPAAGGGASR